MITGGQLQQVIPGGFLYADVEPRANSTVMKLKVSWITTPSTAGTFEWSGDTVTWTSPTISRPQSNVRMKKIDKPLHRLTGSRCLGVACVP